MAIDRLNATLVCCLALLSAGCDLCGEETSAIVSSPDGTVDAALMVRNCGATTGYVTHVNLFAPKDGPPKPAFTGTVKEGQALVLCDQVPVEMTWDGPSRLTLRYPGPSAECGFKQIERLGAIQIEHQAQ